MYMHKDNYYRIASAHLQCYDQVKSVNKVESVTPNVKDTAQSQKLLPQIGNYKSRSMLKKSHTSLTR